MQELNFPLYKFQFKNIENKLYIFDEIRKKFVVSQPEEWVRQNTIKYLLEEKKYPKTLLNIEKKINVNGLTKRYDIVIYRPNGEIFLIVECKAPQVKITQEVFDQIARYNLQLKAENLMITNGISHYFCQMDYINQQYIFLKDLPPLKKN